MKKIAAAFIAGFIAAVVSATCFAAEADTSKRAGSSAQGNVIKPPQVVETPKPGKADNRARVMSINAVEDEDDNASPAMRCIPPPAIKRSCPLVKRKYSIGEACSCRIRKDGTVYKGTARLAGAAR